jgi:hypothetical protein
MFENGIITSGGGLGGLIRKHLEGLDVDEDASTYSVGGWIVVCQFEG